MGDSEIKVIRNDNIIQGENIAGPFLKYDIL